MCQIVPASISAEPIYETVSPGRGLVAPLPQADTSHAVLAIDSSFGTRGRRFKILPLRLTDPNDSNFRAALPMVSATNSATETINEGK